MTTSRDEIDLEQSHAELHDLCQPLTALQCRLEIGKMLGDAGSLEEAINGALEETRRMFEVIARMRQRLLGIEGAAQQESAHQETEATREHQAREARN
jgi:C4-dicarboxylate-specific signal transduction histidine kinase